MKSKLKAQLLIPILCLITFSAWIKIASGQNSPVRVECDIHAGPCIAMVTDREVSLEINPKPVRAMQELTFTVSFSGKKLGAAPYIDLGMPGMNMGRNRVTLKQTGENRFEGKGVVVRCPSGRRTWKARITAPDLGSVEFIFDVIY